MGKTCFKFRLLETSIKMRHPGTSPVSALATSTVRIPTPGSIQLVENYTELYRSNRWGDTETYLQYALSISKACSAVDEADKTWLNNANYQFRVKEQIAQETLSADTDEVFIRASISEDEF
ncbi:hypothetical protein B0H14DRAFT_2590096 [Mycena olivaceomarginata]|nr:hypothetical protein B0H14DRAFT_2590096 [Mycena olivaceomarginata]